MPATKLQIIQLSLGVEQYGRGDMYRNHFCPGGKDLETCKELESDGLMRSRPDPFVPDRLVFHVTDKGKNWMFENSPKPPRRTKSQKRYEAFLGEDDCRGLTFGEWLKAGLYKEYGL